MKYLINPFHLKIQCFTQRSMYTFIRLDFVTKNENKKEKNRTLILEC